MRKLFCLVAVVAAALLPGGCAGTNFSFEAARQIQPGMTGDQVRQVMGKPFLVSMAGANEIWVYSYATAFGSSRSVSFLLCSNRVVQIPDLSFIR